MSAINLSILRTHRSMEKFPSLSLHHSSDTFLFTQKTLWLFFFLFIDTKLVRSRSLFILAIKDFFSIILKLISYTKGVKKGFLWPFVCKAPMIALNSNFVWFSSVFSSSRALFVALNDGSGIVLNQWCWMMMMEDGKVAKRALAFVL